MQFSIYRVWLLSKKQWAENQQLYLLGLLATAGIMAAAFLFHSIQPEGLNYNNQQTILLAGAGIAGAIFSSTILSKFTDKIKGIQALTLPASALEKLITALIFSLLIFPLAYLLVTYPVLVLMHYIDNEFIGHTSRLYTPTLGGDFSKTMVPFLIIQAMVLLCSVMFKRYTIIKTVVLVFVVFFGVILINPPIANHMLDVKTISHRKINIRQILYNAAGNRLKDTVGVVSVNSPALLSTSPYDDATIYLKDNVYTANFSLTEPHTIVMSLAVSDTAKLIFKLLAFLAIPFLWLVTWLRLKETQL